tara:strand:- start:2864 stop:3295 length:432 start_codon:yes stop_codon:yes gene_type:complete
MKILILIIILINDVRAEQTFSFKSPAFSGIGYSSHVQTIENTETTRKQAIISKKLQAIEEAESKAKNTTLQKFLNNFESRVYAQLSTQLINNLFGENPKNSGTVTIEGNTITYLKSADQITMSIVDDRGNTTDVTVPIGSFTF